MMAVYHYFPLHRLSFPHLVGGGGPIAPTACSSGGYSFDATNGWTIKIKHGGQPWRSFAYLQPCGPNAANPCVDELRFSFQFTNVTSWQGYIKLLFFGDTNNVLGLWPNRGMKLVGFPQCDNMPSKWAGEMRLVDGAWYDIKLTLASSMQLEISRSGQTSSSVWHPLPAASVAAASNGPRVFLVDSQYMRGQDQAVCLYVPQQHSVTKV
ncbi:Aste57867_16336 [Aphanomyces stellatus]|uniref:Aste57867_16336 protein n=1 Tax=Aphanomyces stellatus TaxID=120398 RepID=A0A485L5F3_9STRA|nr:hypothetical protein As57867_016279 [Aphanomyces stellatus]VFT93112.1 Aste57867_16336 [Aphanomyces stellatus]